MLLYLKKNPQSMICAFARNGRSKAHPVTSCTQTDPKNVDLWSGRAVKILRLDRHHFAGWRWLGIRPAPPSQYDARTYFQKRVRPSSSIELSIFSYITTLMIRMKAWKLMHLSTWFVDRWVGALMTRTNGAPWTGHNSSSQAGIFSSLE